MAMAMSLATFYRASPWPWPWPWPRFTEATKGVEFGNHKQISKFLPRWFELNSNSDSLIFGEKEQLIFGQFRNFLYNVNFKKYKSQKLKYISRYLKRVVFVVPHDIQQ